MDTLLHNFTGQMRGVEAFLRFPSRRLTAGAKLPHDNPTPVERKRALKKTDEDFAQLTGFFHDFNEELYEFIVQKKVCTPFI